MVLEKAEVQKLSQEKMCWDAEQLPLTALALLLLFFFSSYFSFLTFNRDQEAMT